MTYFFSFWSEKLQQQLLPSDNPKGEQVCGLDGLTSHCLLFLSCSKRQHGINGGGYIYLIYKRESLKWGYGTHSQSRCSHVGVRRGKCSWNAAGNGAESEEGACVCKQAAFSVWDVLFWESGLSKQTGLANYRCTIIELWTKWWP